ncbi:MAG: hypothetical protein IJS24_03240 [Eubacterium sp.]|nr:hypothetical protein [Eubacterium sp.]
MDNKRIISVIEVILFILILAAGSSAVILGACEGKTYSELEKRELESFPEVNIGDILSGKYERAFSDALADHFYGRDALVTAKNRAEIALGKREIDGTYISGDRLIGLYKDSDFDEKQIRENISYLTDFMAMIGQSVGYDHVRLMLVPGKNTVYRDELPWYMPVSERTDKLEDEIREALEKRLADVSFGTDAEDDEDVGGTSHESDSEDIELEEDGFNFDEGDPDADGFDFDEGDPDAESDVDGFNFEEGDPDAEDEPGAEGFNFEEGDPDAESGADGFNFEEGDPDAESSADTDKFNNEKAYLDSKNNNNRSSMKGDANKSVLGNDLSHDSENKVSSDKLADESEVKKTASNMIISLRSVFEEKKDEYIYYLTDHHWTMLGAGFAYDELLRNMPGDINESESHISDSMTNQTEQGNLSGNSNIDRQDQNGSQKKDDFSKSIGFETVSDDFLGTDYNRLHFYGKKDQLSKPEIPEADKASIVINNSGDVIKKDSIYDTEALKTADKYNYYFGGNYSSVVVNTDAKTDKKLLIIKDSYANSIVPYLCKDYKMIIMVDPRYISSGVTGYIPDGDKPDDVMIVYNEEKFMQDTHQFYLVQ